METDDTPPAIRFHARLPKPHGQTVDHLVRVGQVRDVGGGEARLCAVSDQVLEALPVIGLHGHRGIEGKPRKPPGFHFLRLKLFQVLPSHEKLQDPGGNALLHGLDLLGRRRSHLLKAHGAVEPDEKHPVCGKLMIVHVASEVARSAPLDELNRTAPAVLDS